MSGQLVKPNCIRNRAVSGGNGVPSRDSKGAQLPTHVDHAPLSEQVLVAKGLAILVGQQERSSDLWASDPRRGGLHPFPFADFFLLGLKVVPQTDSGSDKDCTCLQSERLYVWQSVSDCDGTRAKGNDSRQPGCGSAAWSLKRALHWPCLRH